MVLLEIFRFELRHHLRSPLFWLAGLVFFLLSFGAVTSDVVTIGGSIGNVNRNAPFVIMQILTVMSVVGIFVTTAFVAGAVLRDYEHRTQEILFSTPIRKTDYLLGRFSGALTVSVLIFLWVALSIAVGSFMPWLEPDRVGPFELWPYLFSMLFLVLPNILLMSCVFFSVATLTRSMMSTYASVIAFFVGYLVSGNLIGNLDNERLAALADPFGFGAFELATKYWTSAERNTRVLSLDGPFLENRIIWLSVGLVVLAFTFHRFSFTVRESRRSRKMRSAVERAADAAAGHSTATLHLRPAAIAPGGGLVAPAAGIPSGAATAAPATVSTARTSLHQLARQTRHEVLGVVKSLPFQIILAMGVINVIGGASFADRLYGTAVYPRTHLILRIIEGSFLLFTGIVLTVYSGELVWRERGLRLDEVFDALPVRNQVFWGSKFAALCVVVISTLVVAMLTGMGIQLYNGYTHLEPILYLEGLFLKIGSRFVLIAALALFLQVVTNNKYVGYLLMVLYFLSDVVLGALHYDHNLYRYADTPDAPWSDMNGYGHFVTPLFWFTLYWALFAVMLVVAAHLLWVRGKETAWGHRLSIARSRLTTPVIAVFAVTATGFVATGGWIFYNTNILNEYVPGDVAIDRQVRYEKDYKQYERIPQPSITAIRTDVDIFPETRAADLRGTYHLLNKADDPIGAVHLTINPRLEVRSLDVPGATLESDDAEVGYRIYRLSSPLQPGDETDLTFDLALRNPGFVNNDSDTRIVYNGTFLNSDQYFPHVGYRREAELTDPVERRRHGLPEIERMPSIDDAPAKRFHALGREADWVDFETTVSTSADQIALAPGYLIRDWEENGRHYFHYRMDAPILAYVAYLSARWEVARDHWNDVDIAVYYHPDHPYNVQRMIDATKKSLDYFTTHFGPYQHRQFRIIEFPRYARFAESFPNTIPFSESIGFIARLEDPDSIDYVSYVTAHELAHQWWAHQVIPAGVQGSTMIIESLAQYSALMVMEKEYGPDLMRRFLKYELDAYLRGRGRERIEELPIMLVEDQPYIHYNKGSLVTYALRDYIGERQLDDALSRYVHDDRFQGPPYTTTRDLLSYVEEEIPEDRRSIIEDLFETITLYENRAKSATWEELDDGRYRVRLEFESHKFRADGQGNETEIPVDDWMDLAVFGERGGGDPPEGKVLLMEKRHITVTDGTIEVVVDERPRRAGIDPLNKLVDRNPENNLTTVRAAG